MAAETSDGTTIAFLASDMDDEVERTNTLCQDDEAS